MVVTRTDRDPRGLLDVGEDFTAHDRMLLDLSKFLVRQPALLLEDLNGDANLAHIVKQSRKINLITFLCRLANLFGNSERILRNATGMTICVGIFGVYSTGQRIRGLFKHDACFFLYFLSCYDFRENISFSSRLIYIASHDDSNRGRDDEIGDCCRIELRSYTLPQNKKGKDVISQEKNDIKGRRENKKNRNEHDR